MATKVITKTDTKVNSKAADKEKLAAERAKLIEKAVPAVVKPMSEGIEAETKMQDAFTRTWETAKAQVEKYGLTRDETTQMVKLALCEAKGITLDQLKANVTLATGVSKIVNLAFPKDEKIAKEIVKALEKGVTQTQLNKVATGGITASQAVKSLGKGGNVKKKSEEKKKNGKGVFEDLTDFANEFVALLGRCTEGGHDKDDVTEAYETAAADYYAMQAEETE